jgi:hypothetical protein
LLAAETHNLNGRAVFSGDPKARSWTLAPPRLLPRALLGVVP